MYTYVLQIITNVTGEIVKFNLSSTSLPSPLKLDLNELQYCMGHIQHSLKWGGGVGVGVANRDRGNTPSCFMLKKPS